MKRALTTSPPVISLMRASAQRRPSSSLASGDEARTTKPRELRRVAITVRHRERVDRRRAVIVGEDLADRLYESAFAVAPRTVQEIELLLAGDAGETVTGDALQVGLELRVTARHLAQERHPLRAIAGRTNRRLFRHVVVGAVRAHLARAQVDDAIRRVEQPWIRVPVVDGGGDALVAAGQADNGIAGLGAGDLPALAGAIHERRDLAAQRSRHREYEELLVL